MWEVFAEAYGVPVNSCRLFDDACAAREVPTGDLLLAYCAGCGFIGNAGHRPGMTTYDATYEETQGCSPRFRLFAQEVARRWVERYDVHDRDVLEIGCGKGEFLALLAELGGNRCVGMDPAMDPGRAPAPARGSVRLLAESYDERCAGMPADVVVCRHTLEHIGPVAAFLRMVRTAVRPDTVLLFELPDAERVLRQGAIEDVYYEHCSYFTAGSLSRLFRRCGFEVLDVELAYDDQYLLLEARPGRVSDALTAEDHEDLVSTAAAVERFRDARQTTARTWRTLLERESRAGTRTVLWGGGSKAVAFLTSLGLGHAVDAVVDINPMKQGRAMPGTGHPVVSPKSLVARPPDLVVVMNPVYVPEVQQTLATLQLTPRLIALGSPDQTG